MITKDNWFSERIDLCCGLAISIKINKVLHHSQSKFQDILIVDSITHGKILILDGIINLTERDEYTYHEMMIHTPLFAHYNPKSILVIGGGDGGSIREILKHELVKEIVWIEIDGQVIDLCQKYFPSVYTKDVLNDKRVQLLIDDGIKYVTESPSQRFDVIIVDSSDPVGPGEVLFEKPFYQECYRILKPGGILCAQGDCFWVELDLITKIVNVNKEIGFIDVQYASMLTPSYSYGQLGLLLARKCNNNNDNNDNISIMKPIRTIPNDIQKTLKYYNGKVHSAAFVLPTFVIDRLQSKL